MLGHPLCAQQITTAMPPFSLSLSSPYNLLNLHPAMTYFLLAEIACKHKEYDTLILHSQQHGWNTKATLILTTNICGIINNSSINKLKDMDIPKFEHPVPHGNTLT